MAPGVTIAQARQFLDEKAKPPGSLGLLEEWGARLCVLQDTFDPSVSSPALAVFAADHGAALPVAEGGDEVSAYPASVTAHVLRSLGAGRAAGTVLARAVGVSKECIRIVDVGVCRDRGRSSPPGVFDCSISQAGTKNFAKAPAMSLAECVKAEACGAGIVAELAAAHSTNAVALGEVGIGNTTSSAALLSAFTEADPADTCGPGTGLDGAGVSRKADFVRRALAQHSSIVENANKDPRAVLAALGGLEIAAIVGAIHEASSRKIAVLVDGFIVSIAALVAVRIAPSSASCLFLATRSAEPGHLICVNALTAAMWDDGVPDSCGGSVAALDMGLRLGEGTGAVMAIPVLRSAAAVCTSMETLQNVLQGT